MKKQIKANIDTKIDHKTLHFLPFVPTRTRKKGYHLQREWGDFIFDITARETLNTYDLMTLLFTTREYLKTGFEAGYIGEGEDKKEIAGIKINVKQFLNERNVLNKKANRETLKKSFLRLKTIDLTFTNKETKEETYTSYIYEIKVDKDISEIKIYANKRFIEFIIDNGILVNLNRLLTYGDKEQYAILLDLYLQGTKKVTRYKNSKRLQYRERYYFSELEKALKLDLTKLEIRKKRQKIKEAFEVLREKGDLPPYAYDKAQNAFIRTDIDRHKFIK